MEMTINDYFTLLCQAGRPGDASEYIEFLDIYGADYTDYLMNIPNLDCKKSVKNKFFSKLIDLAKCDEMQEVMDYLIENRIEGKIKMKAITKIFKVCSDEKILELEEEILGYGTQNHKNKFQKIKLILEK